MPGRFSLFLCPPEHTKFERAIPLEKISGNDSSFSIIIEWMHVLGCGALRKILSTLSIVVGWAHVLDDDVLPKILLPPPNTRIFDSPFLVKFLAKKILKKRFISPDSRRGRKFLPLIFRPIAERLRALVYCGSTVDLL